MTEPVQLAMRQAARNFVLLDELADCVGARLAELTGAEWGMVTAGSAAGLALAAAACVAGNDPERILRLPFADGLPNVALAPDGHRFAYDHGIRAAGCNIREFATVRQLEELLGAEPVALISILGDRERQPISLEQITPVARRFAIPVVVDAASEFLQPPISWLERGADLVVYSVGKFMRGPGASGLLLGRKRLVRAAWINSAPHQALGRTMKVSKEQIVGALIALEEWLKRDIEVEGECWLTRLEHVAALVHNVPGALTEMVVRPGPVPKLRVTWNTNIHAIDSETLCSELLAGTPRILVDDIGATGNSVLIDPFNLADDEAPIVGKALANVLERASPMAMQSIEPPAYIGGHWRVSIEFANGPRHHHLQISQNGEAISGTHQLNYTTAKLEGLAEATRAIFQSTHELEGNLVRFSFRAVQLEDNAMEGIVTMGSSAPQAQGPLAFGQFGQAKWHATRLES
jgi:seryl-tRNA(Sec) selenium transferase